MNTKCSLSFRESDEAPDLPSDPCFQLEANTVFLKVPADMAGNSIIRCLEEMVHARDIKVSPTKFSVKAEAAVNGFVCQVQVRIYKQASGIAVEFQRRHGDALAFHTIFTAASQWLGLPTASQEVCVHPSPGQQSIFGFGSCDNATRELGGNELQALWWDVSIEKQQKGSGPQRPSLPPCISDCTFPLEGTSITLHCISALDAAQQLMDFFEQSPDANVTKVEPVDFSIKVEASIEGLTCAFKVFMYRYGSGIAIEFLRRRGDALAFHAIFRQAAHYLDAPSRLERESCGEMASVYLPPPPAFETFCLVHAF
jgi:hypothetical protein